MAAASVRPSVVLKCTAFVQALQIAQTVARCPALDSAELRRRAGCRCVRAWRRRLTRFDRNPRRCRPDARLTREALPVCGGGDRMHTRNRCECGDAELQVCSGRHVHASGALHCRLPVAMLHWSIGGRAHGLTPIGLLWPQCWLWKGSLAQRRSVSSKLAARCGAHDRVDQRQAVPSVARRQTAGRAAQTQRGMQRTTHRATRR